MMFEREKRAVRGRENDSSGCSLPANHYSLLQHSAYPAVVVSDLDHGGKNVVPGLRLHHDFVGEHATVPTDVFEFFRDFALAVAEPVAGVARNVELPAGI